MGEQADRLLRGDWYLDDEELQGWRRQCTRLLDRYNGAGPDDEGSRKKILVRLFAELGSGAVVMPPFQCSYGKHISVGENAFVNSNALLMDDALIRIGAYARLGPGAQLMTALHPIDDRARRREGWERAEPITVLENVWLGASVVVGAGVTVGRNSVVGAGSVVLRDVPDNVLAAGNPARILRALRPNDKINLS
jgi:maltose O-acetyltransferase